MAADNLTWVKDQPAVRTWNADDGAGTTWQLTITDNSSYFTVELLRNGTSQGSFAAESVEQVADLFEAVAGDLRTEGF
jgi:hypothetical protein